MQDLRRQKTEDKKPLTSWQLEFYPLSSCQMYFKLVSQTGFKGLKAFVRLW